MNRRKAIALTGSVGTLVSIGVFPALKGICGVPSVVARTTRPVRLVPVPGADYSDATLAFMKRARFDTPRQAIHAVKDPKVEFFIEHVSA